MNPELEKYYEDRFSMFLTQGWKDLMEDVELMVESTDHISSIKDEKDLHFKRGELSIMTWLKSLKSLTEMAYNDLKAEENAKSDI